MMDALKAAVGAALAVMAASGIIVLYDKRRR